MKDRNKLIISIVVVILIAAIVVGGTFAYWTWSTNASQNTYVGFTVTDDASGDIYAHLIGNGVTTVTNMEPAVCSNTTYAVVKTVQIKWKNNSNNAQTVTASLNVTDFAIRNASYKPTTANLQSLKWAIRSAAVTSSAVSSCDPDGNSSAKAACNACSTGAVASGDFSGITMPSSGTTVTSGLPKTLGTVSFTATANTTTEQTQTYYLYIWLDANYAHTNYGSTNDDPMQGLTFTVNWTGTMQ